MNPRNAEADRLDRLLRIVLPIGMLAVGVIAWDLVVRLKGIPPYVLPGPGLVFGTLVDFKLYDDKANIR